MDTLYNQEFLFIYVSWALTEGGSILEFDSMYQPSVILVPEIPQCMEHLSVMVLSEEHHKKLTPSL